MGKHSDVEAVVKENAWRQVTWTLNRQSGKVASNLFFT